MGSARARGEAALWQREAVGVQHPLHLQLHPLYIDNDQTLLILAFSPQVHGLSPPQQLLQCLCKAVWKRWLGHGCILLEGNREVPLSFTRDIPLLLECDRRLGRSSCAL